MKKLTGNMLEQKILEAYGIQMDNIEKQIEIPPESSLGDFSFPCFLLAKQLKKNPAFIAEELKEKIQKDSLVPWMEEPQVVGGYLNIFINREFFVRKVLNEAWKDNYGGSSVGKEKTICIDYSSPNIAKKFHVGHLRTTLIGNSLYKILSKMGYQVVRINHLGDWGTQFGKLIVAYQLWSNQKLVEEKGIEELLRIYVKFGKESESHPELDDEARIWFAKMERAMFYPKDVSSDDIEALDLWKWFIQISLIEFDHIYQMLNITFDSYHGESYYMDKVPTLVEELKEKGLLVESEGANIISLEEYGMPPCLITKKDGSSIYHSRDLAAVLYRKKTYDFSSCLYVTGTEQKLHFSQVFQALELMGYDWAKDCHHISYGMVSMGGEKLSTRKGNIVYAEDILKEAIMRAQDDIRKKNPELNDQESVAKKIGVGAVIFHDLSNQLSHDVQFDWDAVLNFEGMTAPYIQYTFARANSILRKVGEIVAAVEIQSLTDDVSYELVKQISRYEEVVSEAALKYEPSVIARYVYKLAVLFNRFYQECRIVNEESKIKEARTALTYVTQKVIGDAMGLLGIECPEEM